MIGLLSVPTWLIHISSVVEWGVAMLLFWLVGRKLNNIWLRRMPLAMLPYMLSGWCALIYHMSLDEWGWLNDIQAYLTFSGSCCFCIWAWLLLKDVEKQSRLRSEKAVRRG